MSLLQKTRNRKPTAIPTAAHFFFAVCIREVSSKMPKDFFGVYRYFAGAGSEYWNGALKKMFLVGVWRVHCFHHSQNPVPWFTTDGSILCILAYAGVGLAGWLAPSPPDPAWAWRAPAPNTQHSAHHWCTTLTKLVTTIRPSLTWLDQLLMELRARVSHNHSPFRAACCGRYEKLEFY